MTRSPWLITFGDLLTLILVLCVATKDQNLVPQQNSRGYQQDSAPQFHVTGAHTLLGTAFASTSRDLKKQTLVTSIGFSETELNKVGVTQRLTPILADLPPAAMAQITPCLNLPVSSWQEEDDRTLTIATVIRNIRPDISREIIVSDRGCDSALPETDSMPAVRLDLFTTDFAANGATNEPR